ncbi:MAG: hypothetical protein MRZ79_06820 [Bacteroidia bacterium]|nr:hypothetical protein [Bacteroidia bacterium]
MKSLESSNQTYDIPKIALPLLLALIPVFLISMLSLLFVMFELRIGRYLEAIWQSFIFVSFGVHIFRLYLMMKGKYNLIKSRQILNKLAFFVLAVQVYVGIYGIIHLIEDQHVMDHIFWLIQFYGFALVGATVWGIRKLTNWIARSQSA